MAENASANISETSDALRAKRAHQEEALAGVSIYSAAICAVGPYFSVMAFS